MIAPDPSRIPETRLIEGGWFVMGSARGLPDEQPEHRVRVGAYRAGVAPVSNAQYGAFLEATGAHAPKQWGVAGFAVPDQPVIGVSWHDAVSFCEWLSELTGRRFRLPTEAEREHAARGGLEGADWPWGDAAPADHAAVADIALLDRPHAPRASCINAFGLACMAENVHEWCSDWHAADWYARSPELDPVGPPQGARRSSRGGSFRHAVRFTRVSARSSLDPAYRYDDYGFRVFEG